MVWVIWSANRQGQGGQLRAYNPIPVNGQLQLVYSAPIGTATNYSTVGVGTGRLYVGTRDGTVLGFGSPVVEPVSGSAVSFPTTTTGTTSQRTLTVNANQNVTIQSVASTSSQFTVGTPSPTLPASLGYRPVAHRPDHLRAHADGLIGGQVNVRLSDGTTVPFSLSGTGQSPTPQLAVNQKPAVARRNRGR